MFLIKNLLASAALAFSALAFAAPTAAPEWVGAVVVKTDAARSKITLKHERIKSLPMAAMTMPFKVHSEVALAAFQPGDKVRFVVQDDGGELLVTRNEPARAKAQK